MKKVVPLAVSLFLCAMVAWMVFAPIAQGASAQGASIIYVAKTGADTNKNGTSPNDAVLTISQGLKLASNQGGGEVRVAIGTYDEPSSLTIPANTKLTGGWDNSFATDKRNKFTSNQLSVLKAEQISCTERTCVTASQSDRVLTIANTGSSLEQMVVIGPDRSNVENSSSFGVIVDGASTLLDFIVIKAGEGGTGTSGATGKTGSGYSSSGGMKGYVSFPYNQDPFNMCHASDGEEGETIAQHIRGGSKGGAAAPQDCMIEGTESFVDISGNTGGNGGPGDNGDQGNPGTAIPATFGNIYRADGRLMWRGDTGEQGETGTKGAGGGGGGPGASFAYKWVYVFWAGEGDAIGGVGGKGGDGGSPSDGGGGGGSGGSSFGLLIVNASVNSKGILTFGGVGGKGGSGGTGGPQTPGETGEKGNAGTCPNNGAGITKCAGKGGDGGDGGKGGAGGGGAGGNGGVAVNVVTVGTQGLKTTGTARHVDGQGGSGGLGGEGGQDHKRAATGIKGKSTQQATLDLK